MNGAVYSAKRPGNFYLLSECVRFRIFFLELTFVFSCTQLELTQFTLRLSPSHVGLMLFLSVLVSFTVFRFTIFSSTTPRQIHLLGRLLPIISLLPLPLPLLDPACHCLQPIIQGKLLCSASTLHFPMVWWFARKKRAEEMAKCRVTHGMQEMT